MFQTIHGDAQGTCLSWTGIAVVHRWPIWVGVWVFCTCNRRFTGALHRHMNHDGISAFAGNSGIRVGYPTCRFLLPQGEVSAESLSRDNVSTDCSFANRAKRPQGRTRVAAEPRAPDVGVTCLQSLGGCVSLPVNKLTS